MKYQFLIFLTFLLSIQVFAQSETDLDSLFAQVNDLKRPGVATAIIHEGKVIYKKGFGSAHLDYQSPVTPDTKFNIGGMSKHFTAFAILLLQEQGKLSLEDDIREYIPEMKDYGHTITIAHLLSLSSGLHGFWPIKTMTGLHYGDIFTHQHAMKMILSQEELGYVPGTDYSYVNTGLTLLTEIVAKASGQPFASFTKENMFEPLGMSNTLFKTNFEQYISNVAGSYDAVEGGYQLSSTNLEIAGPANLYSTINDLVKWEMNISNPRVGSKRLVEKLNVAVTLSDGSYLDTSFGRVTFGQQLQHIERGILNIYQTGNAGGHASSIFKFIEQDFTVIVLSSGIPYSGYLGMQSAYMFLDDIFIEPATIDFEALKIKKLSAKKLERHAGFYWDPKAASSRELVVRDDTLRYVRGPGNESPLFALDDNTFQMIGGGDEKILVMFEMNEGKKTMNFKIGEADPFVFEQYVAISYNSKELETFSGTFYNKELNTAYDLNISGDVLTATHIRNDDIHFTPIREDLFASDAWYLGSIRFEKDQNGMVSGFWIFSDLVRNLWFEKL